MLLILLRRPENILYRTKADDSDIVIADFGMYVQFTIDIGVPQLNANVHSAKHLHTPDEKLFSIAGSFGYVAPEVLNKAGHSKKVDMWSTG